MEEGLPGELRVITTCREHVLGRAIWRSTDYFANKFHLSCSNHVSCSRNVIEHASNVLIPYSFVLNSRHWDSEDVLNIGMKEDFQFVQESCAYWPCSTAPKKKIHRNCAEELIFTPNFKVWTIPNALKGSRWQGCHNDSRINVIVICEIERDIRAKIFEVFTEGDISIRDANGLRFIESVIKMFFMFALLSCFCSLWWSVLVSVVVSYSRALSQLLLLSWFAMLRGRWELKNLRGGEEDTFRLRWAACSADMHF